MRRLILSIILLTVSYSAIASTVTFDFEDGRIEKDGFRITELPFDGVSGGLLSAGTAHFFNVDITLERIDGGLFSLHSFDTVPIPYGFGVCIGTGVIGATASGDSLQSQSPEGCTSGWQTLLLGPEWTNLVSITFLSVPVDNTYNEGHIDNIVVSNVVPLPTAAWLFLSSLAALAGWRHKVS